MARKYSKKASAKVERAMKKRNAGTLKSGRSGKQGHEPEAGDRDRAFRSASRGTKSPEAGLQEEHCQEIGA